MLTTDISHGESAWPRYFYRGGARLAVAAWVPIVFQGDVLVDCGHRLRMELDPPGSDLVLNPRSASWRKSAVYGLNGHRAIFVIALSLGSYEHAI
jgi:hypothetical protein